MVNENWAEEKEKNEENRICDIQEQRMIRFNRLRLTPPFTAHVVTSLTEASSGRIIDYITMKNGDTYRGYRNEIGNTIIQKIKNLVDDELGLLGLH
jgi:hypothetical protein